MIGKTIRLPFADRDIPIIADDYVDPDFGSGCVNYPRHDFNDYEWANAGPADDQYPDHRCGPQPSWKPTAGWTVWTPR